MIYSAEDLKLWVKCFNNSWTNVDCWDSCLNQDCCSFSAIIEFKFYHLKYFIKRLLVKLLVMFPISLSSALWSVLIRKYKHASTRLIWLKLSLLQKCFISAYRVTDLTLINWLNDIFCHCQLLVTSELELKSDMDLPRALSA